jgi:cyclic pyranopterin phosphate synthase
MKLKSFELNMVDVGAKPVTTRRAVARGEIRMAPATLRSLRRALLPKGDAAALARVAGILAAKKTSDIIPLCHPLPLDGVEVEITYGRDRARIRAEVRSTGRTGVEMEALCAAAVAALTLYDMAKSQDKEMVIGPVYLEEKSGGRSGNFYRRHPQP